ncbi:MAG: hypothetical protein VR70_08740 [Rhodospirillaceae bacterium BRH_c57]|nr:MAG: hypothetical protein VR70_08740 [Rhodospirillaceae bacterium BRH_c57]
MSPTLPQELMLHYRLEGGDGARVRLLASQCGEANRLSFPRRAFCGADLTEPEEVEVPGVGTVYCYTVVRTRAPYGLPTPYAVGYVDIDGTGLRVFGLFEPELVDDLEAGLAVELQARPLGIDNHGEACLRPLFCRKERAA